MIINIKKSDELIPIIYPLLIERDRYYFNKDTHKVYDSKINQYISSKIYSKGAYRQVSLVCTNSYKKSLRFSLFKLYYLNCIHENPESLFKYNFRRLYVKAIDGNYNNFDKDNFLYYKSDAIIDDIDELEPKTYINFPVDIIRNRYAFNKNLDVIDTVLQEKVGRRKNKYGGYSYQFKTMTSNFYMYIDRAKLLLYNFKLSDSEKLLSPYAINVIYKDNDKTNQELDNLDYTISPLHLIDYEY